MTLLGYFIGLNLIERPPPLQLARIDPRQHLCFRHPAETRGQAEGEAIPAAVSESFFSSATSSSLNPQTRCAAS